MNKTVTTLLAVALTACAMCAPASAYPEDVKIEEMLTDEIAYLGAAPVYALGEDISAYEIGDVNMDGAIDARDANLVLAEFNLYTIVNVGHILDENQRVLADFDTSFHGKVTDPIDACDASGVLTYYTYCLVESDISLADFRALWSDHKFRWDPETLAAAKEKEKQLNAAP